MAQYSLRVNFLVILLTVGRFHPREIKCRMGFASPADPSVASLVPNLGHFAAQTLSPYFLGRNNRKLMSLPRLVICLSACSYARCAYGFATAAAIRGAAHCPAHAGANSSSELMG